MLTVPVDGIPGYWGLARGVKETAAMVTFC